MSEESFHLYDYKTTLDFISIPSYNTYLKLLHEVYSPSEDTLKLKSESNRTFFPELLEPLPRRPRKLWELSIRILARCFRGDPSYITKKVKDELLLNEFWNLISTELPLKNILKIDSELYWKRVYYAKIKGRMVISEERLQRGGIIYWKALGVSEKLREFLENRSVEDGFEEVDFAKALGPFMFKIKLTKLQQQQNFSYYPDPNLSDYTIQKYHWDDTHHIDFTNFGEMYNLNEICLEFQPVPLGRDYNNKYFIFSTLDMQRLGSAISRLQNLKTFKLTRSNLNSDLLFTLIPSFKTTSIEKIDFSFDILNDDCAYPIAQLFRQNRSLKSLELKGNYFTHLGMATLCYGIQIFNGKFQYFGISKNPISDKGCLYLLRALNNCDQVTGLSLCGIEIKSKGCKAIIEIIRNHTQLTLLDISCLPFGERYGDQLIDAFKNCKYVVDVNFRDCDLTYDQEYRMNLLAKRNKYIERNPFVEHVDVRKSNFGVPDEYMAEIRNPALVRSNRIRDDIAECLINFTGDETKKFLDTTKTQERKKLKLISEKVVETFNFNSNKFSEKLLCAHIFTVKNVIPNFILEEPDEDVDFGIAVEGSELKSTVSFEAND